MAATFDGRQLFALRPCASAASISAARQFQRFDRDVGAVELVGQLDQRRIAARAHIGDDAAHDCAQRLPLPRAWRRAAPAKSRREIARRAAFSRRAIQRVLVIGPAARRPGAADVGQLGVDAFHRQAQRAAAGKNNLDHPAGIFAAIGREVDRQQRDHRLAARPA